jgi:hypothetical protein
MRASHAKRLDSRANRFEGFCLFLMRSCALSAEPPHRNADLTIGGTPCGLCEKFDIRTPRWLPSPERASLGHIEFRQGIAAEGESVPLVRDWSSCMMIADEIFATERPAAFDR